MTTGESPIERTQALRGRFRKTATSVARERFLERRRKPILSAMSRRKEEPEPGGASDYLTIKADLQARLLDRIGQRDMLDASEEDVSQVVQEFVAEVLESEEIALNRVERRRLGEELVEEALGVGPLAPLMADPAVTDILVNGPRRVYVERFGRLEPTGVKFRDDDHLLRVIERIAARVGRRIDVGSPMVDVRLPDGSRVNATVPPVSIDGPTLSIRRFGHRRLTSDDLLRFHTLSASLLQLLRLCVRGRLNILISGGTGAGKSTLLSALAEGIDPSERILTIEDTAELVLDQEHVVRFETRPPNVEGQGTISARDLVINALRMRPDRIVVGEVRGPEALDMLQAMNTGHDGGMCTVHANSPRDALRRLETMVLMAGLDLPSRAIREQIASALDLVIHVRRFEDGVRRIERISEITGMEGDAILQQDIYAFRRRPGRPGAVEGSFVATGVVPDLVEELEARDIPVPRSLFSTAGTQES